MVELSGCWAAGTKWATRIRVASRGTASGPDALWDAPLTLARVGALPVLVGGLMQAVGQRAAEQPGQCQVSQAHLPVSGGPGRLAGGRAAGALAGELSKVDALQALG